MGSTPATANQPLYEKLRNQGFSKGEAARLANESPLKKPSKSEAKRVAAQKAAKK
jgi:hypothetical protein